MLSMEKRSRFAPGEIVEKAVAFFGPGGLGLEVAEQERCCARFKGAGGFVFVQAEDVEGARGAKVNIEGREWEIQIKEFLGTL